MVFSELYSAYYNTVAKIVKQIIDGGVDNQSLHKIIRQNAFEESVINMVPAIREEKWQVVTSKYNTPIKHNPSTPLTTLQKRWLKAILLDERIKLFDLKVEGLDDVEPLFTQQDYCIYDKYSDGDNFGDAEYIERFKTILYAVRNKMSIKAQMVSRKGNIVSVTFTPKKIEYSEKDDKFRVLGRGSRFISTINVARIVKCSLHDEKCEDAPCLAPTKAATIILLVKDERNALERAMLHFAHFEKRVEKIDGKNYKVSIKYDSDDEQEMVIRVLAFGPLVEVVEPLDFRELIKDKLKKQLSCELK